MDHRRPGGGPYRATCSSVAAIGTPSGPPTPQRSLAPGVSLHHLPPPGEAGEAGAGMGDHGRVELSDEGGGWFGVQLAADGGEQRFGFVGGEGVEGGDVQGGEAGWAGGAPAGEDAAEGSGAGKGGTAGMDSPVGELEQRLDAEEGAEAAGQAGEAAAGDELVEGVEGGDQAHPLGGSAGGGGDLGEGAALLRGAGRGQDHQPLATGGGPAVEH